MIDHNQVIFEEIVVANEEDKTEIDVRALMEACEAHAQDEGFFETALRFPVNSSQHKRYIELSTNAGIRADKKMLESDPKLHAEKRAVDAQHQAHRRMQIQGPEDHARWWAAVRKAVRDELKHSDKVREAFRTRCAPPMS